MGHRLRIERSSVNDLRDAIRTFIEKRDWEQFHSPKNLAMALSVEVAEIVEHFQWLTEDQSRDLLPEKLVEYCPVDGHAEEGMEGKLTVKEGSGGAGGY
jgi:NTP pyrophosphatase (non-canonical NTP hydrolase)